MTQALMAEHAQERIKINSKQITLIDRWSMEFFFIRLMVANFCSVSFDRFLFLWETEDYLQNWQKQIALGYFYVCSLHCYLQKFSNGTDKETSLNNQELFKMVMIISFFRVILMLDSTVRLYGEINVYT